MGTKGTGPYQPGGFFDQWIRKYQDLGTFEDSSGGEARKTKLSMYKSNGFSQYLSNWGSISLVDETAMHIAGQNTELSAHSGSQMAFSVLLFLLLTPFSLERISGTKVRSRLEIFIYPAEICKGSI